MELTSRIVMVGVRVEVVGVAVEVGGVKVVVVVEAAVVVGAGRLLLLGVVVVGAQIALGREKHTQTETSQISGLFNTAFCREQRVM